MITFIFYIILLVSVACISDAFADNLAVDAFTKMVAFIIIFDGIFLRILKKLILTPLMNYAGV